MNSEMQRVIVGYDGSEQGRAALDWAADEASRRGAPLHVVYAIDLSGLVGGPSGTSPWLPQAVIDTSEGVSSDGARRARARVPALEVTSQTKAGRAAAVLLDASAAAQLLVVGTHGHGDLAAAFLGATVSAVTAQAACPVAVATGDMAAPPGPRRPIVVGVDGSEASGTAVRFAAAAATASAAPLMVVCAWRLPRDTSSKAYWISVDSVRGPAASAELAAHGVAETAVRLARGLAPDVPVEAHVAAGSPARVILDAARGAGLVVVGARGRGAFSSLVLGSVSHRVIHRAPCPVTVVRAITAATSAPLVAAAASA